MALVWLWVRQVATLYDLALLGVSRILKVNIFLGHIQISQVPSRHEPDEKGELNFPFILNHLMKIGYDGWIGCEYVPSGT